MPDFSESRAVAKAALDSYSSNIKYYDVLATWTHASDARLMAAQIPNTNLYVLVWRSSSHYNESAIYYVSGFEDSIESNAWERLMRDAQTAFEKGPPSFIAEKAAVRVANLAAGNSRGGQKSGETRSAKAREREELFQTNREQMKAAFDGELTIPKYDPAKWKFQIDMRVWQGIMSVSYKAIEGCYIAAIKRDGWWFIERGFYPDGNNDNARIEEEVGPGGLLKDIIFIFNNLAASDPLLWQKGVTKQFKNASG